MEESTLHIITAALLLLFPIACLVSCVVAAAFEIQDEEEQRIVSRLKLPVSIVGNAVVYLLVFAFLFPYQSPISVIGRLITLGCSYQDISRFVMLNVISLFCAAVIPVFVLKWKCSGVSMIKRNISGIVLILSVCMIPLIAGIKAGNGGLDGIRLSEVCRKTTSESIEMISGDSIEDEGSYIIIRNEGILDYEAGSLCLSVDENQLNQKYMKDVRIQRGGSYVYQMRSTDGLNIKKSGGSVVYLSGGDGSVIDKVKVPALEEEQAYRRSGDGWEVVWVVEPEKEPVTVDMPVFSAEGGFYDNEFDLTISAPNGTRVYYTLDGSNPTAKSSRYNGAIHVYDRSGEEPVFRNVKRVRYDYKRIPWDIFQESDRCFVVRAVAVDGDGNISPIKTASYFINADQYRNGNVISLVSDPDGLFGENGICVTGKEYDAWYEEQLKKVGEKGNLDSATRPLGNFEKHGDEWEREASFELFENAEKKLSKQVGIRVQGNYSRHDRRMKRFSVYARERYDGTNLFDIPLVNEYRQHSFVLREGGSFAVTQHLSVNRAAAFLEFIPVTVFLDGEFYYQTFMYEKFSEANFAEKYHIMKDNVVMIKNGEFQEIDDDGALLFKSMVSMFVNSREGEDLYEAFSEYADIQSYIDALVINLYMANMDYEETWNNILWRTVVKENDEFGDAKWRWGILDVDLNWQMLDKSYGKVKPYQIDPFTMRSKYALVNEWVSFPHLIVNEEFRKRFVMTFMDLMNYDFSPERAVRVITELNIENEELRAFFERRPEYMVKYLAKEYHLSLGLGSVTLTSNRSGAPITLNTITPELENGTWSGQYFTDYPVTVTANEDGFSHWEVTINGKTKTLQDKTIEVPVEKGGVQIYAVYQ